MKSSILFASTILLLKLMFCHGWNSEKLKGVAVPKTVIQPLDVQVFSPTQCPNISTPSGIPMELPIPGGFTQTSAIFLTGKPKGNRGFTLTFLYDRTCGTAFTPLQLVIDMMSKEIIRNANFGYSWGKKDTEKIGFPFREDTLFHMAIFYTQEKFIFHVNGEFNFDFNHRLPPREIRALKVEGAVQILSVGFAE